MYLFSVQVVHDDSLPSEIVFTVQSPPTLGVIQRLTPEDKKGINNGEQQHLYQVKPTLQSESSTTFTSHLLMLYACSLVLGR